MSTIRTKVLTAATAAAIAATGLLPTTGAIAHESAPQDTPRAMATARAATARYHDVAVAEADGFRDVSGCVASPQGGMGHHYLHPGRLDTQLVIEEPEVLLYERDARGRLRLTGVEYIVLDADRDPATVEHHTLAGEHLHGPMAGPLGPQYVLHAWIWKHNPAGQFSDWNPNVTC